MLLKFIVEYLAHSCVSSRIIESFISNICSNFFKIEPPPPGMYSNSIVIANLFFPFKYLNSFPYEREINQLNTNYNLTFRSSIK